jgi:hypothetical protein
MRRFGPVRIRRVAPQLLRVPGSGRLARLSSLDADPDRVLAEPIAHCSCCATLMPRAARNGWMRLSRTRLTLVCRGRRPARKSRNQTPFNS